jgi:peptide/nickel transport system substrate-binding protein
LGAGAVGAAGLVIAGCGGTSKSSGSTTATATAATGVPKRGGTFRFGGSDGSTSDSLDSLQGDATYTNKARNHALYDLLVRFDAKTAQPQLWLAEELEPAPDLSYWTVRVREAEFHNGKPVTADDVMYTLRRVGNPKAGAQDTPFLASIDLQRLHKLDSRTVRLNLHYPDAFMPYNLRHEDIAIVPAVGYDPKKPIGSGPFKYQSFTPGQESTFIRNPNYWQSGKPYLDELQVVDFADPGTTRINALTTGQIQGADHILFSLTPTVESATSLNTIISHCYQCHTWEMRMDMPPFNDVRVRQAIKLIAGRPQIVEQAFSGSRFASVGNDLPGPLDPLYDHSIPQRAQDIEQAKSLLKQAGRENLTVSLAVSAVAPGVVETAQVLSQQAKAAGVTINVNNIADAATYFSKYYVQAPFKFDYWPSWSLYEVWNGSLYPAPGTSVNLSYYHDPKFTALYKEAQATADPAKRKEIMSEAQKLVWDTGTQGIFAFYNCVDAHSAQFTGFQPNVVGDGLNGLYFENVGLA